MVSGKACYYYSVQTVHGPWVKWKKKLVAMRRCFRRMPRISWENQRGTFGRVWRNKKFSENLKTRRAKLIGHLTKLVKNSIVQFILNRSPLYNPGYVTAYNYLLSTSLITFYFILRGRCTHEYVICWKTVK